jgi:hypothetical protein
MALSGAERQREYRIRQAQDQVVVPIVVSFDTLPALAEINPALVECSDADIRDEMRVALEKIVNGLEAPSS